MNFLEREIKAKAKNLGFSFVGFTEAKEPPHFQEYSLWLEKGQYANLHFLNKDYVINSRKDPRQLMIDAKSIIILGINYQPNPIMNLRVGDENSLVAAYACYEDYHGVIRLKARQLMDEINSMQTQNIQYRIFIDSGPLMEKDFAFAAGLGWIGKNSLFIHPLFGSYNFLCAILVNQELQGGLPLSDDLCGNCTECLKPCPTRCIQNDRTIDVKHCISYLTIEHKGLIPRCQRPSIGSHIFGCDICQSVCPRNANNKISSDQFFFFRKKKIIPFSINLRTALSQSESVYQKKFGQSPVRRISYDHFMRNCIIAAGNNQHPDLIKPLVKFLDHDSEQIRVHTAWALGRFRTDESHNILLNRLGIEKNDIVKDEIIFALRI